MSNRDYFYSVIPISDIKNIDHDSDKLTRFVTSIGLNVLIKSGPHRCKDYKNMVTSRKYLIIYTQDISLYENIHRFVNDYCVHSEHRTFNNTRSIEDFVLPEVVKTPYEKKRDGDKLSTKLVYKNGLWVKDIVK